MTARDGKTQRSVHLTLHEMFDVYKVCMVHIAVETPTSDQANGSGFHIGDGLVVTARHVMEGNSILALSPHHSAACSHITDVLYPSDPQVDLAVLKTDFNLNHYLHKSKFGGPGSARRNRIKTDHIPLGLHFDDWIGDEFVLSKVLLMGYPKVPLSDSPVLVAHEGEVNGIVDKYLGPQHPYFIISPVARGGFSGGPVISEYGFLLGVATESLVDGGKEIEAGFSAVLTIEPLLDLLHEHGLRPKSIPGKLWDEFYDDVQ